MKLLCKQNWATWFFVGQEILFILYNPNKIFPKLRKRKMLKQQTILTQKGLVWKMLLNPTIILFLSSFTLKHFSSSLSLIEVEVVTKNAVYYLVIFYKFYPNLENAQEIKTIFSILWDLFKWTSEIERKGEDWIIKIILNDLQKLGCNNPNSTIGKVQTIQLFFRWKNFLLNIKNSSGAIIK